MRAVRVERNGGPEVLVLAEVPTPTPNGDQVLVRSVYAGVNYIDIYHREGAYPLPLPMIIGSEGMGVRQDTGERVAWCMNPGSYAEHVAVSRNRLVAVPDGVPDDVAAAALLQGMTAHYLAVSAFPTVAGQVALVHAAAGGVGLLLCQMLTARGVMVIGTVSTPEKVAVARAAGATHVIGYEAITDQVRELTDGVGAHVVYDGVGKSTFDASFASLRPRGVLVLFGAASGQPDPLDVRRLAAGSLYVTRPGLADYTATPEELQWRAGEVFAQYLAGTLTFSIGGIYPLDRAADAHRDLESRATSGKLLISMD